MTTRMPGMMLDMFYAFKITQDAENQSKWDYYSHFMYMAMM